MESCLAVKHSYEIYSLFHWIIFLFRGQSIQHLPKTHLLSMHVLHFQNFLLLIFSYRSCSFYYFFLFCSFPVSSQVGSPICKCISYARIQGIHQHLLFLCIQYVIVCIVLVVSKECCIYQLYKNSGLDPLDLNCKSLLGIHTLMDNFGHAI